MRLIIEKLGYWPHSLVLLLLLYFLVQCRPDVGIEQNTTEQANDTTEVTSFDIDRELDPALANWQVFEAGKEIICAPPGWQSHIATDAKGEQELVILPPNSTDSTELISFARFENDSPEPDDNTYARRQAKAAFESFPVQKSDSLKQLIFQQGFAYERTTRFANNGASYRGYCIVYVNNGFTYIFRVILSEARMKANNRDLLRDIIGNLQVNKQYLIGNENPIEKIVFVD